MANRKYRKRYCIEPWNEPAEGDFEDIGPGIVKNTDDYGFTDELFIVSILMQENVIEDVAVCFTTPHLTKEVWEKIKIAVNKFLE